MSGRFVRASKFRHVHGEASKTHYSCDNLINSGDGFGLTVSSKYMAYPCKGGGGPVTILPADEMHRIKAGAKQLNVHKAKVLDMQFNPFIPSVIGTTSDDCTAAITVIPDGWHSLSPEAKNITTANAVLSGHNKKVSMLRFNPSANNILATCSTDSTVKIWDAQQQANVFTFDVPTGKYAQAIAWSAHGDRIYVRRNDKKVSIVDPRNVGDAITVDSLQGLKCAHPVAFTPGTFAVCGSSNRAVRQVVVYDERKAETPLFQTDIDQGAGMLMPMFDEDNSILYVAGKGDGNIRYFEWTEGRLHFLSEFRSSDSTKGVAWFPKRDCAISKCEVARAYRMLRDKVFTVSFMVPRKSDMFQEDIYPDAYAGVPAIEAKAWAEGKDAVPSRITMNPAERGDTQQAAVSFEAQMSPAELRARVAELEALVKKQQEEIASLKAT